MDFATGGDSLLRILLLPLVCQMLRIPELKLVLFLCLHHKIITQFLVDVLEGDLGKVYLRRLLDKLMDGALLAGDKLIIIGGFFSLFEHDGFFGVSIGFDFSSCLVEMVVYLFVYKGVS